MEVIRDIYRFEDYEELIEVSFWLLLKQRIFFVLNNNKSFLLPIFIARQYQSDYM